MKNKYLKIQEYKRDRYKFNPPPVCPVQWGQASWIRFIDAHGAWYHPELRKK